MEMDEIIVAGEPCLVIRSPLIPRTLLCNSLLQPLLSRLKSAEEFVAFVSEPCVAPQGLDVVLVTAFWPRCVFDQASEEQVSKLLQTIKPQHLMLVERELYMKLTKKSCLFGDFLDSLLLHNEDKRKVSELLSKIRSWIRDNKSYGLFFLTEVRGMEDFIDQAASIFEIIVKAEVETEQDEPLLRFTITKHPNIAKIDKKIEVAFEKGQPKRRRG
jgi:pentose-5-phosphate-3-epimerase